MKTGTHRVTFFRLRSVHSEVRSFSIGTLDLSVRNSSGNAFFIASPMLDFLPQTEIKLNWLPMTPFLVYMHGTHLTFRKPFVRKQYNVLVFFNRFCEKYGSANRITRGLLL